MSYPIHYVPAGDVLPIFFSTYGKTNGESLTMTGLAVTDIEIYKDGSTTQRSSDAGYTLLDTDGIDFDSLTGIHGFSIDTGDNTDSGFYTVGAWFHVVVSAVTVDSSAVSFIAAAFRLMPAEAVAGKPKVDVDAWLGTAAATPATNGHPVVTLKVGTGTGEVNLSSGAVPTKGNVKKNTALAGFMFMMTDSTGHAPATGKTVTVTRSIDGAAFAGGTLSSVTEVGNGIYSVDFGAGDLNGNNIVLRATATSSDDTFVRIITDNA